MGRLKIAEPHASLLQLNRLNHSSLLGCVQAEDKSPVLISHYRSGLSNNYTPQGKKYLTQLNGPTRQRMGSVRFLHWVTLKH